MKRFILILSAALAMTGSAWAQVPVDAQPQQRVSRLLTKKLCVNPSDADATISRAPRKSPLLHYRYNGSGQDMDASRLSWTMLVGTTEDGTPAVCDIIPDCFNAGGIVVPIGGLTETQMRVAPTYLGTYQGYHVYLIGDTDDLSITFTLHGDGRISLPSDFAVVYGGFSSQELDLENYAGYFEYVTGITYEKDILPGDTNADGEVTAADSPLIVNHILGREQPDADADAMDANTDGEVNVADVIKVSNIVKNSK